jgi:hypothetical protein
MFQQHSGRYADLRQGVQWYHLSTALFDIVNRHPVE